MTLQDLIRAEAFINTVRNSLAVFETNVRFLESQSGASDAGFDNDLNYIAVAMRNMDRDLHTVQGNMMTQIAFIQYKEEEPVVRLTTTEQDDSDFIEKGK